MVCPFLYIDPLKQVIETKNLKIFKAAMLYIDSLKQGLKHNKYPVAYTPSVFIHRSIKTRIETSIIILNMLFYFLYIDPLKQGLKRDFPGDFSPSLYFYT